MFHFIPVVTFFYVLYSMIQFYDYANMPWINDPDLILVTIIPRGFMSLNTIIEYIPRMSNPKFRMLIIDPQV